MCVRPQRAFAVGHKANGYPEYKLFDNETKCVIILDNGKYKPLKVMPTFEERSVSGRVITDYIDVPCGKCVECRLARAKEWSNRCLMELPYHKFNQFVTLTYDDEHIPFVNYEGVAYPTLVKRDVQLFLKRLRKNTGQKFRYFGSGEYGSTSGRPHYHLILFGLQLNDLEPFGSRNGNKYYISETIMKAWHFKGHCIIGQVNEKSVSYVARYTMKKMGDTNEKQLIEKGIQPTYAMMSRNPGIGRQYYDDMVKDGKIREAIATGRIPVELSDGGIVISPPRYFKNLYNSVDSGFIDAVRSHSIAVSRMKPIVRTDLEEDEYNELRARTIENRVNKLKRPL